jgi:hypothetical protein
MTPREPQRLRTISELQEKARIFASTCTYPPPWFEVEEAALKDPELDRLLGGFTYYLGQALIARFGVEEVARVPFWSMLWSVAGYVLDASDRSKEGPL